MSGGATHTPHGTRMGTQQITSCDSVSFAVLAHKSPSESQKKANLDDFLNSTGWGSSLSSLVKTLWPVAGWPNCPSDKLTWCSYRSKTTTRVYGHFNSAPTFLHGGNWFSAKRLGERCVNEPNAMYNCLLLFITRLLLFSQPIIPPCILAQYHPRATNFRPGTGCNNTAVRDW